jgi:hypothetical protein
MAMHARTALLAGLTIAMLALAIGSAVALRSIQVSNPGAVTATGANISFEEEGRFLRTVCSGLTLSGSLNERVAKRAGAAAGTITEGRTTGCRAFGFVEARVTVEATRERPFTKKFNAFLGTLPPITGILYLDSGVRFTIVSGGRTCRYEGEVGLLVQIIVGGDENSLSFLPEPKPTILAGSTAECPAQGSLRGSMRFERTRMVSLV